MIALFRRLWRWLLTLFCKRRMKILLRIPLEI